MSRRRTGAGITIAGIATCLLILPLAFASPPQRESRYERRSQPENGREHDRFAASAAKHQEGSYDSQDYKHFHETLVNSNKPSAIATFAPAISNAVRAPRSVQGSGSSAGLSPLLNARSLQDWQVEDIVLLATVDGQLHARDRNTGEQIWEIEMLGPMVETVYHHVNKSDINEYQPEFDFLWIIEPSKDGEIYMYNPGSQGGLQRLDLTVRKLAEELSPYAGEDPAVVYTAKKETELYIIDAATGIVNKKFDSHGSTSHAPSCKRYNFLEGREGKECRGSLTLGRTEYTVGIQHRDTAEPICTLKYSEWGPNNRDNDLQSQYSTTMDKKYVYSRFDGGIIGLDRAKQDDRRQRYIQKLTSPVARVFDIVRPLEAQEDTATSDTQLVILPQPIEPVDNEERTIEDQSRVFINKTMSGGWFAMSEHSYPSVTWRAAKAHCYSQEWQDLHYPSASISPHQRQDALIGVHSLSERPAEGHQFLTISGPAPVNEVNDTPATNTEPSPISSAFALNNSKILQGARTNILDIVVVVILGFVALFVYVNKQHVRNALRILEIKNIAPNIAPSVVSPPTSPIVATTPNIEELKATGVQERDFAADQELTPTVERVDPILESPPFARNRGLSTDSDRGREKSGPRVRIVEPSPSPSAGGQNEDDGTETPTPTTKKKARRGVRGGAKHKKKNKNGQNKTSEETGNEAVEQAVQEALQIAPEPPAITPEVETVVNTNVTDVSGPIIQIGHLKVDTEVVLGFGSHGTVVYRGTFGGRDVAVKRMLQDFYDIASHEVGLLQESDDHPNVIRYYDKESAGQFLYIALELCPASLQDVVEKPTLYPSLLGDYGLNPQDVLKQITAGLQYLHSLKIVHRDIKPQNILVSAPKKLPRTPDAYQPPRLLISDFGLCKKLEGDQSSFRATTAHAAGTSGWRAPELLVDDDATPNHSATSTSSIPTSGHSHSEPLILDTQTNRRATRAIDIFSLGCVFYYVLTGGGHPFDRDGKFMREGNIIKGNYNLSELDKLGDDAPQTKDLVASMLALNPKSRPDAATILAHPFFWDAQKRLDFLCHVSDAFEFEPRDPPSAALQVLEDAAISVLAHCRNDFLSNIPPAFKDTLGRQRKYSGHKLLDLLRALRNKKNHYEDMPEEVKKRVGPLPGGYLHFWMHRFAGLLMACHQVVLEVGWEDRDRFRGFYRA